MKPDGSKIEGDVVDAAWEQATKLFANSKAMRPRASWLTGVSVDTAANRVQRLLGHKRVATLYDVLKKLDAAALQRFLQRTEINLERASVALRLNLVVNISAPIGALVIVNQLFPEFVSNFVAENGMDAVIVASASVLVLLLFSIWYSYCCVTQVRDLAHLTKLYPEHQFDSAGALNDFDDEPLNPAELA